MSNPRRAAEPEEEEVDSDGGDSVAVDEDDELWDDSDDDELVDVDPRPKPPTELSFLHPLPVPIEKKMTIGQLYGMLEDGTMNLSPAYQRDEVWPESNGADLIASLLEHIIVPPVTMNVVVQKNADWVEKNLEWRPAGAVSGTSSGAGGKLVKKETWVCADGKQRLTNIRNFINGVIPVGASSTARPSTRYFFTPLPSHSKSARYLSEATKARFLALELNCTIYDSLTRGEEVRLFSMIQRGKPLSTDEKLRANEGAWSLWVSELLEDYCLDDGNGFNQRITKLDRAKDYVAILQIVSHVVAGPPRHMSPIELRKILLQSTAPTPAQKLRVDNLFRDVSRLSFLNPITSGQEKYKAHRAFVMRGHEQKRLSPVEFLFVFALVHQWKSEGWHDGEILEGIEIWRSQLHAKFPKNVSKNSIVGKWITDWIEEFEKESLTGKYNRYGETPEDLRKVPMKDLVTRRTREEKEKQEKEKGEGKKISNRISPELGQDVRMSDQEEDVRLNVKEEEEEMEVETYLTHPIASTSCAPAKKASPPKSTTTAASASVAPRQNPSPVNSRPNPSASSAPRPQSNASNSTSQPAPPPQHSRLPPQQSRLPAHPAPQPAHPAQPPPPPPPPSQTASRPQPTVQSAKPPPLPTPQPARPTKPPTSIFMPRQQRTPRLPPTSAPQQMPRPPPPVQVRPASSAVSGEPLAAAAFKAKPPPVAVGASAPTPRPVPAQSNGSAPRVARPVPAQMKSLTGMEAVAAATLMGSEPSRKRPASPSSPGSGPSASKRIAQPTESVSTEDRYVTVAERDRIDREQKAATFRAKQSAERNESFSESGAKLPARLPRFGPPIVSSSQSNGHDQSQKHVNLPDKPGDSPYQSPVNSSMARPPLAHVSSSSLAFIPTSKSAPSPTASHSLASSQHPPQPRPSSSSFVPSGASRQPSATPSQRSAVALPGGQPRLSYGNSGTVPPPRPQQPPPSQGPRVVDPRRR